MIRVIITTIMLLALAGTSWAAAITSAQSGNWSATATWVGGVKPGDGDTAVIATGHTVTVDENTTVGATTGTVAGVTINGTNSTTYGTLQVADGVTLTLKGVNSTYPALLINRYAIFEPLPGSTINFPSSVAHYFAVYNKGIIRSIGTAQQPVTWQGDGTNYSWGNTQARYQLQTGVAYNMPYYEPSKNIKVTGLGKTLISNTAGTGLAYFNSSGDKDTSVVFDTPNQAGNFTNEVASEALVVNPGDYWIDYTAGRVLFYTTTANPTVYVTFKYHTLNTGFGIQSVENTTYNSARFEYCTFQYFGAATGGTNQYGLYLRYKTGPADSTSMISFKNNTVRYCGLMLALRACNGTAGQPIEITNNTFRNVKTDSSYGPGYLNWYNDASSYVTITGNDRISLAHQYSGTGATLTGIKMNNNTGRIGNFLSGNNGFVYSASEIKNNDWKGWGGCDDARLINMAGGVSAADPLIVEGNTLSHNLRAIQYASFMRIRGNVIDYPAHHGFTFNNDNYNKVEDVEVSNNIFHNIVDNACIELGYNHSGWIDNYRIYNNTFGGSNPTSYSSSAITFGDNIDNYFATVLTRIDVRNNIIANMSNTGIRRRANSTKERAQVHISHLDHNLLNGNTISNYATGTNAINGGTYTKGGVAYNVATAGQRNIAGVSLHTLKDNGGNLVFTGWSEGAGKTLVFTYNSATDMTLAWDGGTPVQLVLDSGTSTSFSDNTNNVGVYVRGSLGDTTKNWPLSAHDINNNLIATCPAAHWAKITSGARAGEIRAITGVAATSLLTTPRWGTLPTAGDTYSVIKSEVTLTAADGSTIQAGIYLPDLPTTTQTDTNIGLSFNDTLSSPVFANASGTTAADFKLSGASPAVNVGVTLTAVTTDFWGTVRPQSSAYDIGAYEYFPAAASIWQKIFRSRIYH